jgi:dUTP pyrophosphatase
MIIRIKLAEGVSLPQYQTQGAAGIDLRANILCQRAIKPMERMLIPTGLFIEIPKGHEGQIRPRSGLAAKHGITVLNSPGTIDSDFRGEIHVLIINFGEHVYALQPRERIAQLVFSKFEEAIFEHCELLSETERGAGGFGSTGK